MPQSKASRNVVITGASRGLGRAMTERFIELGHTVYACARNQQTMAELAQRWPRGHRFDAVDVADDAAVARWAKSVLPAANGVDLLINNAALINRNAPLWEVPADEFSRLVDVNIKGVANVIRHFAPDMVQRASGVIVNFSSGWGRSASANVAPYCTTKWAIEGLSQALALEVPDSMAVVALNPGVIDTDMLRSSWGDAAEGHQQAESWARRAVPFFLEIEPKDNGRPLTVPEQ